MARVSGRSGTSIQDHNDARLPSTYALDRLIEDQARSPARVRETAAAVFARDEEQRCACSAMFADPLVRRFHNPRKQRRLFVPQRHHRIDLRRPPGGQV
jgi:hypothetical protein